MRGECENEILKKIYDAYFSVHVSFFTSNTCLYYERTFRDVKDERHSMKFYEISLSRLKGCHKALYSLFCET